MNIKIDTDLLNAALLGLELRRQAVDLEIGEIRRRLSERVGSASATAKIPPDVVAHTRSRTCPSQPAANRQAKPGKASIKPRQKQGKGIPVQTPVGTAFENRAGHYELIRVEAGQAYYSFTNRQGKTIDAVMPVIMWQRMQDRAGQDKG